MITLQRDPNKPSIQPVKKSNANVHLEVTDQFCLKEQQKRARVKWYQKRNQNHQQVNEWTKWI